MQFSTHTNPRRPEIEGTGDWVALEAYGALNGTLRRMRDLSAAVTGRPAIASGQIWRSMQVPT